MQDIYIKPFGGTLPSITSITSIRCIGAGAGVRSDAGFVYFCAVLYCSTVVDSI